MPEIGSGPADRRVGRVATWDRREPSSTPFVAAGIDYLVGRWDDSLAESEAGLEAATAGGAG